MTNYWLMKTEPNTFSIHHLADRPNQTEPWDGVRNFQARNFIKSMQISDGVLFYHSNCKVPGIVGLAEVASAPYPDPTQFDPDNKYYDAKSKPDAPRWYLVDVRLTSIFTDTISLNSLKDDPDWSDSPLIKKGNRLSVMPVDEREWQNALRQGKPHHDK